MNRNPDSKYRFIQEPHERSKEDKEAIELAYESFKLNAGLLESVNRLDPGHILIGLFSAYGICLQSIIAHAARANGQAAEAEGLMFLDSQVASLQRVVDKLKQEFVEAIHADPHALGAMPVRPTCN